MHRARAANFYMTQELDLWNLWHLKNIGLPTGETFPAVPFHLIFLLDLRCVDRVVLLDGSGDLGP